MLNPITLKVLGIGLSLLGTIILAIRVTRIISALSMAVQAHDLNFQIRVERASGNRFAPPIQITGSSSHVENAEKSGITMLVLGFVLQISGGLCNAASLLL